MMNRHRIQKDNTGRVGRSGNLILPVLLAIVFFLSSCGIPNPIPVDIRSMNDIDYEFSATGFPPMTGDLSYDDGIDSTDIDFSQTHLGFNIYYEYTETSDENTDLTRLSGFRTEVKNVFDSTWSENTPKLEIDDPNQKVNVHLSYVIDGSNKYFLFELYEETNTTAIGVNGSTTGQILYNENKGALLTSSGGGRYLHLYIEYFVRNPDYSPNFDYSNLAHLGYFDTNEL